MQYKLHNCDTTGKLVAVSIIGQTISIPINPENRDYQEYLAWVAEGNTPEAAD